MSAAEHQDSDLQAVQHRVLQAAGRRFSIKLEGLYWQRLEEMSSRRGKPVRELVREIAEAQEEGEGLTAALRRACVEDLLQQRAELSRVIHDQQLSLGFVDLAAIVDACPAPCLVMDGQNLIRKANPEVERWLGVARDRMLGQPLDQFFQLRVHPPLREIRRRFARGHTAAVSARLAYVLPGRVMVARARLCPGNVRDPEEFSYLLMVDRQ